jgi:hypothetical protein
MPNSDSGSEEPEVSLKDLIDAGILTPGKLAKNYNGTDLEAELLGSGVVMFNGEPFGHCSGAAVAAKRTVTDEKMIATGKRIVADGWDFWRYQAETGNWVPLNEAKKKYLAGKAK